MRNGTTLAIFTAAALSACHEVPDPATPIPASESLAELDIPDWAPPETTPTFRMVRVEGAHGPGFTDEGAVTYYVQDHALYTTSDGCHIQESGNRSCSWQVPQVVAAGDGVAAFSLPASRGFSIIRDGEVQVEIPVNFEVAWMRFDGENIWVMPEKYITGDEPPLRYSPEGELVGAPDWWKAIG